MLQPLSAATTGLLIYTTLSTWLGILPVSAELRQDDQISPFILKCCPNGRLLKDGECMESNSSLLHPFKLPIAHSWPSLQVVEHAKFNISYGNPICPSLMYFLDPENYEKESYRLLVNGSLYRGDGTLIEPEDYCLDVVESQNAILPALCFPEDENQVEDGEMYRIYPVGMLVSVPFLFLTFLVYALIRQLRNLHGCCLMSHVASLLIGYSCLVTLQIASTRMGNTPCKIVGFSVQYFFLATFFWLNVMCIDIYWAFSSVRTRGGRPGGDLRKLLLYSLYAWGMPLLILLATVAVDFSDAVPKMSPFKPNVGTNKCFFEGRSAAYLYFYGPMALLICANMVLFGVTAYRIWSTSRETAALNRGDSRRHSDKQENERFKLYVKLFLVMGINWAAELISFIVGEGVPHYLWYVTDLTNTLQGVFIFIIFVWKRRVRRLVRDRLCMMSGRGRISRSRGGTSSDATTTTISEVCIEDSALQ
ncbi:G-protein coupled receptor Mth2-like isoform X2 [Rhodnius prolixus]|uniref:G-protein coupled receptor Mth2-like isoform X2 n=1 Tax=Rhodnius prolixus TaxID=13249 RepID=UPI003D18C547